MSVAERCPRCGFKFGLVTRDGRLSCTHCLYPRGLADAGPHDVSNACVLLNSVIESLESALRKHGLAPDGTGNWPPTVSDPLERKEYFSALRALAGGIRWRMRNARIAHSSSPLRNNVLLCDTNSRVSNEAYLFWKQDFENLIRILPRINEADLLAEIFEKCYAIEPCELALARQAIPALLLSTNRQAIKHAIQAIRAHEPLAEEILQGEARIRQLDVGDRAAPIELLSGTEFEELLKRQFLAFGFTVEHVGGAGDFGADLLLSAGDGTIIAVQSKRWKARANLKAVQEVLGAIARYRADIGIALCTAGFYPSAEKLAESSGVELWGKERVIRFLDGDITFSAIAPLATR